MIQNLITITMPSSTMDKEEAALNREGTRLEEDFTRLSSAKTAAEKKEAYWTQETTRLGQQVVRTRTTVEAQLKLVQGKRKEVERVQRVLKQEELELGRRRSALSQEESELKDSETSQRIARDNLKVKDSTVNCPGTYTNYYR